MDPVVEVPDLGHCQLRLNCSESKAHFRGFPKGTDRVLYLSMVAALGLHRMYLLSPWNDGIFRSQQSLDPGVSDQEAVETIFRRYHRLEEWMKSRWTYGKGCPTSMPFLLIASSEVNGAD
jgi:hypothetical protein